MLTGSFACRPKTDAVRESLDALAAAAKSRDTEAFFQRVAANFQASNGSGRAEAQATLRRYFDAYETLDVSIRDLAIERAPDAARARFRAELSGQPRRVAGLEGFFPRKSSYDFDLRLVPESGLWKVTWAAWSPAAGASR